MTDPRFFSNAGPYTLGDLAALTGAALGEPSDAGRSFGDIAPLDSAGPNEISFFDNRKYAATFMRSKAGACIVNPDMAAKAPPGMALLLTGEPYRAYARIAALFYPVSAPEPSISPQAAVAATAILKPGCRVEPGAVIGDHAKIGPRCWVGPNAVIDAHVEIGADCRIGACVSISHALIGERVVLYPGVRIGQDGFGYAMGPGGHLKVPQLGRAVIMDDVEIGANATVDRGSGPDTIIGAGTKIDNMVHIAHNVQMGRFCIVAAQAGISGSTQIDDFVVIGGQAGLTGHLKIGAAARIAAQSGVMRDVPAHETVAGSPAVSRIEWLRQCALIGRLREGETGKRAKGIGSRSKLPANGAAKQEIVQYKSAVR
jgi:UDP-3-O-[3-hydroxymyristoyl] glucosamine N-acyltransferase